MCAKHVKLWIGGIAGLLAIVIGLWFSYNHFMEGRPYCHKGIMFGFKMWMRENGMDFNSHNNAFPNINGMGADSLATISNGMAGHMEWAKDYRYVPGLHEDDPGDLLLMYLDRPTRWTWHGSPPKVFMFKKKAWLVIPVDFTMGGRRPSPGGGELSERVSRDEFRSRLRRTLDFVRTNERPHWQTVVAEHTKFLDSIEHVDP
jgi:hypothetical protein